MANLKEPPLTPNFLHWLPPYYLLRGTAYVSYELTRSWDYTAVLIGIMRNTDRFACESARGYLSTCRKHGLATTDALNMLFNGEMPDFMREAGE